MWIDIGVVPYENNVIYLPRIIADRLNDEVIISFGQKKAIAMVKPADNLFAISENSYKNPLRITISSKLKFSLQIPTSLVYQIKFYTAQIVIGPVVGLLFGNSPHPYNVNCMKKFSDHFKIAGKMGGLFYAFSPKSIDWNCMVASGLFYNFTENDWYYGRFPLPASIYTRAFLANPAIITKLTVLSKGKLFNSFRFTKYDLYQYVSKNNELSVYLPPTELSTDFQQIKAFIEKHGSIILKPVHLSRGRGICIIDKQENCYKVYDYRTDIPAETVLVNDTALEDFFKDNKAFFDKYLIQKFLPLAKIDGSPFDIRVVMQKNEKYTWKCNGIECRVARSGLLLTNISRGGYVLEIDTAFTNAFPDFNGCKLIKQQLYELCLKLCAYLDDMGEHFAEFGIDIAIDEDKKLWIIEVNVLPGFKGFQKMDYPTYLKIRSAPIAYAVHLTGFKSY